LPAPSQIIGLLSASPIGIPGIQSAIAFHLICAATLLLILAEISVSGFFKWLQAPGVVLHDAAIESFRQPPSARYKERRAPLLSPTVRNMSPRGVCAPANSSHTSNVSGVRALCETYRAHTALGIDVIEGPGCRLLRSDDAPDVYDANHLEVGPEAEFKTALGFLEAHLGTRPYRNFRTDPFSPPEFEAEFMLRNYVPNPTLQLLLEGELLGPAPKPFDIRPVEDEAGWKNLARLFRADHIETDQRRGTKVFSPALSDQIFETHRRASSEVTFFMVWVDGEPVAFFSSWPGRNGVGMVEDLFTMPTHRSRGIARALIHHCVADARARGAGRVLIGAEPNDTPKNLYAAMGFRPTCMTHAWMTVAKPSPNVS
jgi:GNAT superfamily N-acetyltransferase